MRPISIEAAKRNRDEKIGKAQRLLADAVGHCKAVMTGRQCWPNSRVVGASACAV